MVFTKMNCIKRGTSLMELRYGKLVFRDFLNFSSPMSLDNLAKSCNVTNLAKSVFPYEKWTDIVDIKLATSFPPYADFRSSLGQQPDEQKIREFESIVSSRLLNGTYDTLIDIGQYYGIPADHLAQLYQIENKNLVQTGMDNHDLQMDRHLHTSPSAYETSKMEFRRKCVTMLDYLEVSLYFDSQPLVLISNTRITKRCRFQGISLLISNADCSSFLYFFQIDFYQYLF